MVVPLRLFQTHIEDQWNNTASATSRLPLPRCREGDLISPTTVIKLGNEVGDGLGAELMRAIDMFVTSRYVCALVCMGACVRVCHAHRHARVLAHTDRYPPTHAPTHTYIHAPRALGLAPLICDAPRAWTSPGEQSTYMFSIGNTRCVAGRDKREKRVHTCAPGCAHAHVRGLGGARAHEHTPSLPPS